MTDLPLCPLCPKRRDNPRIHDQAYVCSRCSNDLADQLRIVARVAGEAQTTIAKLDRIGQIGGRAPQPIEPEPKAPGALAPMPLPVDLDAADQHRAALVELLTWARHASGERGRPLTWEVDLHDQAGLAGWLEGQLEWLRHRPEAPEAFRAIRRACWTIERVVDRPADRWYAGPCQCGAELWPTAGVATVRCGECGAEYDSDERKDALMVAAQEVWATAAWCGHFLTSLGLRCTPEMVRGYAFRGRLAPHPDPDPMGYPRYRLGSVRELVLEQQAEERERTLRAAIKAAELAEKRARKARVDGVPA